MQIEVIEDLLAALRNGLPEQRIGVELVAEDDGERLDQRDGLDGGCAVDDDAELVGYSPDINLAASPHGVTIAVKPALSFADDAQLAALKHAYIALVG